MKPKTTYEDRKLAVYKCIFTYMLLAFFQVSRSSRETFFCGSKLRSLGGFAQKRHPIVHFRSRDVFPMDKSPTV